MRPAHRILQIAKWYIPYRGGIETVVEQLAHGLKANGWAPCVLTCHHTARLADEREQLQGIPVMRCQSFGNYFGTPVSVTYPLHYRAAVGSNDIVHFHAPFPLGELVFPLADLEGKKVVVTLHADPAGTRFNVLERLYRPVIHQVIKRADRIVVTSPQMRDRPELLQGVRDKCCVIPLAANVEVVDTDTNAVQALKAKHGIHGPVLLGVGRMVYYKGFEYAVEAMLSIDADLVLVGRGEDHDALQEKARTLGVQDRVHLPGYVSSESLSRYYAMADLFVFPSVTPAEAFGIVQVEAMAHGLPVVNTSLPTGVPFVSPDGKTGLTVPPRDPSAFAQAVNRLLENDALRRTFSENARLRAETFSEEAFIERHLDLYASL